MPHRARVGADREPAWETGGLDCAMTHPHASETDKFLVECAPRCFNNGVRRLISILLLACFGLPLTLSMLAMGQNREAGIPACCRRDGKHHCMMSMAERGTLASDNPQFKAPAQRCPYCPRSVAPAQPNLFAAPTRADAIYRNVVSHPTGVAQTESRRRISLDRSRQKRGPPAPAML